MATSQRTVTPLIGEQGFIGKAITMIAVDWNVDADASVLAMEAVHNQILARGTILAAGAVYDTGTKQDFLLEGDFLTTNEDASNTISEFTSLDGSVTGTLAEVLLEDIINIGTVDSINMANAASVTLKATFKYA